MSQPWITRLALMLFSLPLLSSEAPDFKLNGLVKGTARFLHHFGTNSETQCTVRWRRKGETMEVAEYRSNRFTITNELFQKRIHFSKSELRIYNLRMEDSGHYIISCRSSLKAPNKEKKFNLAIYKPLHSPSISKTPIVCDVTGCNFTLQCLIPNTSPEVSCHWEILQEVSMNNRAFNECTIQVLLAFSSLDTEYVCFINNPADQKNASVSAWQLCSVSGSIKVQCFLWRWWLPVVVGLIFTVGLAFVLLKYEMPCMKKKENSEISSDISGKEKKNKKDEPKQKLYGKEKSKSINQKMMKQMKRRPSKSIRIKPDTEEEGPLTGQ